MAKLTVKGIAKITKPGLYGDGGGLWLQVQSGTSKSWCVRYSFAGKVRQMGLGSLELVGLAEARDAALAARKQVKSGIDPLGEKRAALVAQQIKPEIATFKKAAGLYITAHKAGWKNAKHAVQWEATLATYAFPVIGAKAVNTVTTDDLLRVLEPIWTTKTETATRVRGRIEFVLDYAKTRGWRDGENPARWKGHLSLLLGKPSKLKKVEAQPSCDWREVGAFWQALAKETSVSAMALRFAILTAARTGEVLKATWSEVDVDNRVWARPASHMKGGREHRVPLTDAALSVIADAARLRPDDDQEGKAFIFPGMSPKRPLSDMALTMALRRINPERSGQPARWRDPVSGRAITTHGFRATFRTWVEDATDYQTDIAESALAHIKGDKTEAAYARGEQFEKRIKLMADWAKFAAKL